MAALYAVLLLVSRRHDGPVPSWAGWWDQSQYLRSARALAALRLDADEHWYPLLYPLLEAPFALLTPRAPFVLLDGLCIVGACAGFASVAARYGVERPVAAALFCLTTLLYPLVGPQWLVPWNTTLSAALIWGTLAGTLALPEAPHRQVSGALGLGALLAMIPLTRPADLVVSVVLLAACVCRCRSRSTLAWMVTGGATLVLASYGLLHLAIYGPHTTRYMRMSAAIGIEPTWLAWKAYVILVEPRPWFPAGRGLLVVCPWLVLGAAGLLFAFVTQRPTRPATTTLALVAAGYAACMLTYVDLVPNRLWLYNNVHYFKWLLPLFGLFATVLLRDGRRSPGIALAVIGLIATPACLHLVPRPIGPAGPARLLHLGPIAAPADTVALARSTLTDHAGVLRNMIEYRQTLRGRDAWAVAQKRDFVGDERWRWHAPEATIWPDGIGGTRVAPLPVRPHPIARFAVGWSLGAPCWLPPYPCGAREDLW